MDDKPDAKSLRAEAEARLAHSLLGEETNLFTEELLHELRVHQIELEMQNEELRLAQVALEESRDRYVDLYEFAPVGYLTLTRTGQISEINLTGATLFGIERKKLLRQRFDHFVSPEDRDRWHLMHTRVMGDTEKVGIELALQRNDGSALHVHLDCLSTQAVGSAPCVRMAISDISAMQLNKQLRDLSAHLQSVREEEKTSVAREIHDGLGGTLAALKMDAYWLTQQFAPSTHLSQRAESMYGLLDDALKSMRRILTELRPAMLDELGLLATLEWQCSQFHKRTGIACHVTGSKLMNSEDALDRNVSTSLYRIFQEALTNIARHSGASQVDVELRHDGENITLTVSDNGCGLPPSGSIATTSFGMRGMRERVEQLGGEIAFDGPSAGGLRVMVSLPLPATLSVRVS